MAGATAIVTASVISSWTEKMSARSRSYRSAEGRGSLPDKDSPRGREIYAKDDPLAHQRAQAIGDELVVGGDVVEYYDRTFT